MTEEEVREYRILHMSAGVLLPILDRRVETAKNRLLSDYRDNKELLTAVARYAEAHDIRADFKRKIDNYAALAEGGGE